MGILDKIFKIEKDEEEVIVVKKIDVDKEIDTIILILRNLSTLNTENIKSIVRKLDESYDESILYRLRVDIDEDSISDFRRYFSSMYLGYGQERLDEIKQELYQVAKEKNEAGRNKPEVVEELIEYAKTLVDQYEIIIKRFNQIIKSIDENEAMSEAEKVVMRDYWVNNFMEEELGYPLDLNRKVEAMVEELESLEFGGYGDSEIKKFKTACKKRITMGEKINEPKKHILSEIEVILFTPLKNKYKTNLEVVKLRLSQIENSDSSQEEIDKVTKKAIAEFKEKNGHAVDIEQKVEEMTSSLTKLAKYGYGEEKIKEFKINIDRILKNAEKVAKSQEEILNEIESEYYFFKRRYEECYNTLQNIIKGINEKKITEEEKERQIEQEVRTFKDEMGHPIDLDERISEMSNTLMHLDKGGYGPSKIEEFENRCKEIIEANNSKKLNALRSIKDIEVLYKVLLKNYETELKQYEDTVERLKNDDEITKEELEKSVEELKLTFELEIGHHLEFNEKLEEYKKMLTNLPGGGYGMEAINEFEEDCKKEKEILEDETTIYQVMKYKANILRNRYLNNKDLFDKWKALQLSYCDDEILEEKEQELNNQVTYMLSLSPKALEKYLIEDDKQKKEAMEQHNLMAAVKYLAREEAKSRNDERIYEQRLNTLEKEYNPYTEEDIKTAIEQLTNIDLLGEEELAEDEKIISTQDYIDSTLLMQLNSLQIQDK